MFGLTGQLLTMGAGTAIKAFGFYEQADHVKEATDYNYDVAMNNVRRIDREIEVAKKKARFDVGELKRQTSMLSGRQAATMINSGLAIEGDTSTADVLEDTAMQSAIDAGLIMADFKLNRWKMRQQQVDIRSGAEADKYYGERKEDASYMDMASSLLSGGANIADRWYKSKQVGVK